MKVIFMGTPDFSVGVLEELAKFHEVVAVVTQPDKKAGRGNQVKFSAVKEAAIKLGLPVLQPVRIKAEEAVEELKTYNADIFVVAAFGQILSKEILEMPKYGCINVHASLLPKYRGAAPIQYAVINGDEKSGVTIMQMNEGLDTGDMIIAESVTLAKDETGGSLFDRLSILGSELTIKALDLIEKGSISPVKQNDEAATYTTVIKKDMGRIDWNKDAVAIERLIRGMNPWPSAFTYFKGKTLKLWEAEVNNENYDMKPGTVCDVNKKSFSIQTGDGVLKILDLQLEGKKRMASDAFLRGFNLNIGDVLGE